MSCYGAAAPAWLLRVYLLEAFIRKLARQLWTEHQLADDSNTFLDILRAPKRVASRQSLFLASADVLVRQRRVPFVHVCA